MKTSKGKRVVGIFLLIVMAMGIILSTAGCENEANDGKVEVSIGHWPSESDVEGLKLENARKDEFETENTDIKIVPDTYKFDVNTFMVKASANKLPNLYVTYFTETQKNIEQGCAKDITDELKEMGWLQYINPELVDLLSDEDGRIYGIPQSAYAQGLCINKAIFREAGLVNPDGSIMVPETYEELAEFAQIVKEKTGKAGYVIGTTGNAGGWHFLNLAWSYGTEFMKADADGKYQATFNTQECKDALQYIYDLRWKYDVLPDNKVIDVNESRKIFGTGQAAMMFFNPPGSEFVTNYGMNKDDIFFASMPAGPKGRYTQMGGGVYMFAPNTTPEQVQACLKWVDFKGEGPRITEETLANLEETVKASAAKNEIVMGQQAFDIWVSPEDIKQRNEVYERYQNVDMDSYKHYFDFKSTVKPEEPACCQELYSVLDKCIQEVVNNQNADVSALIEAANVEFQKNHLDKM